MTTTKTSSDSRLQEAADFILSRGPHRVMVNAEGEAVPPKRAKLEHGIVPSIVFIRGDGWTLGAPEHFAREAEALYPDQWIGFMKKPSRTPKPYKRKGEKAPTQRPADRSAACTGVRRARSVKSESAGRGADNAR